MKKLLILLAITMVACTKPENSNDSEFSTNELNLSPAENSDNRTAAVGTEENPIVVDKDAFIETVNYRLPQCESNNTFIDGTIEAGRLKSLSGLFTIPVIASYTYDRLNKCVKNTFNDSPLPTDFDKYNNSLYYKIFGEVVRLSVRDLAFGKGDNTNLFWYKNAPGNKIQKVIFFNGGVTRIENPIPNPFKENIDCNGFNEIEVASFTNANVIKALKEGSLVIDKGTKNVYRVGEFFDEFRRSFFFVGFCGSDTFEPAVCSGVPVWVSGKIYKVGDKVIFKNTLYTKLVKGWQKGPKCY
jgi:hypothetical protein